MLTRLGFLGSPTFVVALSLSTDPDRTDDPHSSDDHFSGGTHRPANGLKRLDRIGYAVFVNADRVGLPMR